MSKKKKGTAREKEYWQSHLPDHQGRKYKRREREKALDSKRNSVSLERSIEAMTDRRKRRNKKIQKQTRTDRQTHRQRGRQTE